MGTVPTYGCPLGRFDVDCLAMAAAILAIAAQAAAAVHAPPPRAEFLPPRAVDHIVVMEERRGDCPTCPPHRRTIARSGSWVKDERAYPDGVETTYSDFASGTSFTLRRNREGAVEKLDVERNFEPRGQYEVRRQATGRRDSVLGEPCEIWVLVNTLVQPEMESCESADGIILWGRFLGRFSPRALSVERRPIRPEEVRPPADLFALAPWPGRGAGASAGAVGYEVTLVASGRGEGRVRILRDQGDLHSSRSEHEDGRFQSASDGASRFLYLVDAGGRPRRLEVERLAGRYVARWEPVPGRPPEQVLGESCIWQDDSNTWTSDPSHECRTADGVPLMRETRWHYTGDVQIERARSVTRLPLAEADLAPPAEALDWASWGVTPPVP